MTVGLARRWLLTYLPIIPDATTSEYGNGGIVYGVPVHEMVRAGDRHQARAIGAERTKGGVTEYSIMVELLDNIPWITDADRR